jgi:hypothetical protein
LNNFRFELQDHLSQNSTNSATSRVLQLTEKQTGP